MHFHSILLQEYLFKESQFEIQRNECAIDTNRSAAQFSIETNQSVKPNIVFMFGFSQQEIMQGTRTKDIENSLCFLARSIAGHEPSLSLN
jgi:hypothetical protein